ncbi:MAG: hypothetical protein ABSE73_17405 [Planctomycetota bacterium]
MENDEDLDRLVDLLLREELGGEKPPELSKEILARAAGSRAESDGQSRPGPGLASSPAGLWRRLRWASLAAAATIVVVAGYLLSHRGDPLQGLRIAAAAAPVTQEMDGYCQLVLEPRGALVINGKPKAREVFLEQGSVTCTVKENLGTLAVGSGLGIVSVRGTVFKVTLAGQEGAGAGQLSVQVFSGKVLLSPPGGADVILAAEKDKPQEGGFLTGILTGASGTEVTVIPDGEDEGVKYLPKPVGGGLDNGMLETLKHLYPRNRVRLIWACSEPRRVLGIELLTPKEHAGTVTGTVVRKGDIWVDVKPQAGPPDRYTIGFTSAGVKKELVASLSRMQKGDTVTLVWSFTPNNCKRIERID